MSINKDIKKEINDSLLNLNIRLFNRINETIMVVGTNKKRIGPNIRPQNMLVEQIFSM